MIQINSFFLYPSDIQCLIDLQIASENKTRPKNNRVALSRYVRLGNYKINNYYQSTVPNLIHCTKSCVGVPHIATPCTRVWAWTTVVQFSVKRPRLDLLISFNITLITTIILIAASNIIIILRITDRNLSVSFVHQERYKLFYFYPLTITP